MLTVAGLVFILLMTGCLYALTRQLSRPTGWFGRVVMPAFLNQGNRAMIEAAVKALEPRPSERIADVGFGGGYALRLLAPAVMPARVAGVEISEAMLAAAKQNLGEICDLYGADAVSMPFEDGSLDGIISVNTIYFWNDPVGVLREFRRVLKPSGRIVLAIGKKEIMRLSPITWFGFRLFSSRELPSLLEAGGFQPTSQNTKLGALIVTGRPIQEPITRRRNPVGDSPNTRRV